jgi:hypothetical protein
VGKRVEISYFFVRCVAAYHTAEIKRFATTKFNVHNMHSFKYLLFNPARWYRLKRIDLKRDRERDRES